MCSTSGRGYLLYFPYYSPCNYVCTLDINEKYNARYKLMGEVAMLARCRGNLCTCSRKKGFVQAHENTAALAFAKRLLLFIRNDSAQTGVTPKAKRGNPPKW